MSVTFELYGYFEKGVKFKYDNNYWKVIDVIKIDAIYFINNSIYKLNELKLLNDVSTIKFKSLVKCEKLTPYEVLLLDFPKNSECNEDYSSNFSAKLRELSFEAFLNGEEWIGKFWSGFGLPSVVSYHSSPLFLYPERYFSESDLDSDNVGYWCKNREDLELLYEFIYRQEHKGSHYSEVKRVIAQKSDSPDCNGYCHGSNYARWVVKNKL